MLHLGRWERTSEPLAVAPQAKLAMQARGGGCMPAAWQCSRAAPSFPLNPPAAAERTRPQEFLPHLEAEREALGDPTLDQEIAVLKKLIAT